MKKLAILIIAIGIAFSYSCKKNKKVQTQISGTLITNGTTDPIRLSAELPKPVVMVFNRSFTSGGALTGEHIATEIARTSVDNNASFSFDLELYEDEEYFIGFTGLDTSVYYFMPEEWKGDWTYYPIYPGIYNSINPEPWAISWARPRFINTNPDNNNNDKFKYLGGFPCDNCQSSSISLLLIGDIDTLLFWVGKTYSGYEILGGATHQKHEVEAKLTRNGIQRDTIIPYFVPPFDTSIVEIRY